jgi:hypothetical protein
LFIDALQADGHPVAKIFDQRQDSVGKEPLSQTQASFSHFCMKLFLAAPESFLPSALTAFGAHASRLHFFRKRLACTRFG